MQITIDSHADHSLTAEHLTFILARFGDREAFFLETVTLPDELPSLPCGLHGPLMGDEPVAETESAYVVRGTRPSASRVCARPTRMVRTMTVIGGPHEGATILYTAYGGPSAPREPFDPGLDDAGREASRAFWAEHALTIE
jgi:hypothetical protein